MRMRRRTTRTFPCACRSKPYRPACPASASGVRHDEERKKRSVPRVRGVPLTLGYPRRPSRGCVPALQREAGEDNLLFFTHKSTPTK